LKYKVKIDSDLSVSLASTGFETKELTIDFNDFLENVCIMQSRELNPSKYINLEEFSHIKSWITSFIPLKFAEAEGRVEDKIQLSANVGVGLAMCSIEKLWGRAEFEKIDGTKKRPDFVALLENGDRLIVESKGTTIQKNVVGAFEKAAVQKNVNIGRGFSERVASVTNLLSQESTVVYLVDPPTDEPRKATELEINSAKAYTYSKLFAVYGFPELSRYFHLLSRRFIEDDFDLSSLNEKQNLLGKILNKFSYTYNGIKYYGQIRQIGSVNTFLGVNSSLLYLETFLSFRETDSDKYEDKNKKIALSKRGFITVKFEDPVELGWDIQSDEIKNNYDFLTISDIDEMSSKSFGEFIFYKFERSGYKITIGNSSNTIYKKAYIPDFIISDSTDNILYYVEVKKITKNNYFNPPHLEQHLLENTSLNGIKIILITNAIINQSNNIDMFYIWDREKLKKIIKKKSISKML